MTKLIASTGICLVMSACMAEGTDPDRAAEIDRYVRNIAALAADGNGLVEQARTPPAVSGDYSCSRQSLSETRQYDRIVAYAANSEGLWPGAIVDGASVPSGLFTQHVFDRAPVTISVSLENLAGAKSQTIENPSLSSYRDGLSGILAQAITGDTAANVYSAIEAVHSREQLGIALGVDVDWLGGGVATTFDFDKKDIRSRFVVKFTQVYYTVDIDQPQRPSDLLAGSVSSAAVKAAIAPTSPPLYVSSVSYGRIVLFTFESEYSETEMAAALDFSYRGGIEITGDVSVTYEEMLSKSNITAYIVGGSGDDAVQSIESYDALMEFIRGGGNYSPSSPGVPIAYKLAYLADNSPGRFSFTHDYEVNECERVSQRVRVVLDQIEVVGDGESGDSLEVYGTIYAAGADRMTLFERDSEHYVSIRDGTAWPADGGLAEGVLSVVPGPGQSLTLGAEIKDADDWLDGADDDLGSEQVVIPFELGWRRTGSVHLTGGDAHVVVHYRLQPI